MQSGAKGPGNRFSSGEGERGRRRNNTEKGAFSEIKG